jgi:anti-sigma factor RsiW
MNTPAPPAHIPDGDIERFARGVLPAAALVPLTDHLAACGDCQRRLSQYRDLEGALGSFAQAWDHSSDHVAESDVHAFVDGRLDHARRDGIARHLDLCEACRDEVRDLRASAATFRGAGGRFPSAWSYAGIAAAAMLVLALAVPGLLRTDSARTGAVPDVDHPASIDEPLDGLAPEDVERVRRTLRSGRLSFPSYVQNLVATRAALRGDPSAPGFELVAPVGTAVLDARTTFRWTPAAPSATYIVTLQDELTGATVDSPVLRTLEWTPELPLTRGRTYLWQVAAAFDGRRPVTPAPPEPPAKLFVLSASDAARAAQFPPSPLVRGILYAELGLLDDAERELGALSTQKPDTAVPGGFLQQVKAVRARETSSPAR